MKDIGLWGPRIRSAYADMGILGYAELDPDALARADEHVALEMDLLQSAGRAAEGV
jgi:hypothetical protein